MRKIIFITIISGIVVAAGLFYLFSPVSIEQGYQHTYASIDQEYGITLDPNVAKIVSHNAIYSRDYICTASFKLSDTYSLELKDEILEDETWAKAVDHHDIVDTYITPFISSIENLSEMKDLCSDESTYIKVITWKSNEYVKRFSILAVCPQRNQLYYFTWN